MFSAVMKWRLAHKLAAKLSKKVGVLGEGQADWTYKALDNPFCGNAGDYEQVDGETFRHMVTR